ncbi:hypothetical protein JCM14469_42630 [Desulfatiferula olefinivorans]
MEQQTFPFFKEDLLPLAEGENPQPETAPKLVLEATQSCKQNESLFATPKTDDVRLVAMKCACGASWCPVCSKQRWAPGVAERLNEFFWRSTRQIVLTIDRNQFTSGQAAYEYVKEKKLLPQLIHNLRRTKNIVIHNWLWVLEWHRDGYPHWHLFVEVDREGAAGKIHFKNILQYWTIGNATESYFERNRGQAKQKQGTGKI